MVSFNDKKIETNFTFKDSSNKISSMINIQNNNSYQTDYIPKQNYNKFNINNNENEIENNNFELNDNLINEKKSNDVNIDYSEFTKNFNFSNFECENNFNLNLIDSNSSFCENTSPKIEMEKDNFPFFINDINNGYDKK